MISHKMHPILSQELYFQIPVFEKINTHQRTFYYFFCFPQKRPKFTLFTRGASASPSEASEVRPQSPTPRLHSPTLPALSRPSPSIAGSSFPIARTCTNGFDGHRPLSFAPMITALPPNVRDLLRARAILPHKGHHSIRNTLVRMHTLTTAL